MLPSKVFSSAVAVSLSNNWYSIQVFHPPFSWATSETPILAEHYPFFRWLSLSSAGFPTQAPEAPARSELPLFSPTLWSHSSKLWALTLQTCLFILPGEQVKEWWLLPVVIVSMLTWFFCFVFSVFQHLFNNVCLKMCVVSVSHIEPWLGLCLWMKVIIRVTLR